VQRVQSSAASMVECGMCSRLRKAQSSAESAVERGVKCGKWSRRACVERRAWLSAFALSGYGVMKWRVAVRSCMADESPETSYLL
jgi:hypothetical protein